MGRPPQRRLTTRLLLLTLLFLSGSAIRAAAQERLCDTEFEDCRQPIIDLIRTETVGIDVEFWFMEDARYVNELINRFNGGLPIRILVDSRANNSKRLNAQMLQTLADAGIPMREKFAADILHHKVFLFHGQNMLEFSKANYTDPEFVPISSTNFSDEAVYFTNDSRLTNSFRRRFDDNWTNTTEFRNYANITGTPVRKYPLYNIDPAMNFPPLEEFNARAIGRMNAEPQSIDAIVYRVTDPLMTNAATNAVARGLPVRIISEPDEYRDVARYLAAKEIDRLWLGGVQIKMRQHQGLTHEAAIVLRGLGEVIFGSSNWVPRASVGYSDEHNFFYSPAFNKPWFYQWFADQFDRKWADTVDFVPFKPLPPDAPAIIAPATGSTGNPTSVTLTWDGGLWAWTYDVYFGTSPNPPLLVANANIGSPSPGTQETISLSNLQPGTTYYWRIVGKTVAQMSTSGTTWSFTTAGTPTGGGATSTPFTGTPVAVPGLIQAENYDKGGQLVAYFDSTTGNSGSVYRTDDVDLEATIDTGGGYNIKKTKAGEWLKYTINVTQTGTYTLESRVANIGAGAKFHVEIDGSDRTGPIAVPDTGDWQTWQTISNGGISLTAGTHVMRVVLDVETAGGVLGNYNWFRWSLTGSTTPPPPPPPSGSTPFTGTPIPIPGLFQAEDFDNGGQGVAYNDTTTGNKGGGYRTTDVDITTTTDTGGGYYVGWTKAGEWLKYTVNVATAGTYTLETRLAAQGGGGVFHLEVDGAPATGSINVPNTGGWEVWQTISTPNLQLNAGTHVLRVVFDSTGAGGGVGNFNWFRLSTGGTSPTPPPPPPPPPPTSTPFGGTPAGIPGLFQAENFDDGGQNLAYYDTSAGNKGGAYRTTDVDITTTTDVGGGYYVGWTKAGEWLKYTVNVATAGSYRLQARIASLSAGGKFHLEVDGVNVTGSVTVPDTGGWEVWQTITTNSFQLTSGSHVLRIYFETENVEGGAGNFNWFQFITP